VQIESQILGIINDKLKNPIYQSIQLLNMKTILTKSNFTKKEGVAVHMVVLHFVYMLVMNKKIFTFMKQSNDSFKKDLYYRLLANSSYNWRSLLSLSSLKILSLLHKIQDSKAIKVLIIDDTVEDKVGKNYKGQALNIYH
jgi:hypothetical protein